MITVVVPIFNGERHLERCLESIRHQTYQDLEVLLVDDGSTDGSAGICRRFESADPRFRLLPKENGGVSSARNLGIGRASGEYVQFADADDWLEPDCCALLLEAMEKSGCDVVVSSFNNALEIPGGCFEILPVRLPLEGVFSAPEFLARFSPLEELSPFIGAVWNKLYRLDFIKRHGLRFREDIPLHEDSLFNFEVFRRMEKLRVVARPLYNYFRAAGGVSLSARPSPRATREFYRQYRELLREFGAYMGASRLRLENGCFRAYCALLLEAERQGGQVSGGLDEIRAITRDPVFRECLFHSRPPSLSGRAIRLLSSRRLCRALFCLLRAMNLRHKAEAAPAGRPPGANVRDGRAL